MTLAIIATVLWLVAGVIQLGTNYINKVSYSLVWATLMVNLVANIFR